MTLALTLSVCVPSAHAATCSALKAELSRLDRGPAVSPEAAKWQDASSRQQKAITAAERDARYFQCGKFTSLPKCQDLNRKIGQMKANLRAIDKQLAKAERKAPNSAARIRQVKAALDRQNCDAPAPITVSARSGLDAPDRATRSGSDSGNGFFKMLFGQGSHLEARSRDGDLTALPSRASLTTQDTRVRISLPSGGTYRTLCVRTCDGYFFPVSFATGKDQFADDAARCSEMCPATETELFVYRNPGETPENMTSLAGIPYGELDNAFRFRKEFVPGCGCRALAGNQQDSGLKELTASGDGLVASAGDDIRPALDVPGAADPASTSPMSSAPVPPDYVPPFTDPDTRLNLELGFNVRVPIEAAPDTVAAVEQAREYDLPALPVLPLRKHASAKDTMPVAPVFAEPPKAAPVIPDDASRKSSIRVVGPEYFVAQ